MQPITFLDQQTLTGYNAGIYLVTENAKDKK